MHLRTFKARAQKLFLKGNPTAAIQGWVKPPRRVVYPTGLRGIYGTFYATAEGYRPQIMKAEWDAQTGLSVT